MDCSLPGSCVPGVSPGKNTGMGCHALLQEIFSAQGSNPCLLWRLHCRWILYHWAVGDAPKHYTQLLFFFNLYLFFIFCFSPQNITFMRTQIYCQFGHCFLHFLRPQTVPGSKEVHSKYSLSKGSLMCEWVSLVWRYKTGEMATITFLLSHMFLPWSRRDLHPTFLPPSCPFLPWSRNKDTCIKIHI